MRAQGYGGPRRARVGASMCQVAWYGEGRGGGGGGLTRVMQERGVTPVH
jgi:hypothetical protein